MSLLVSPAMKQLLEDARDSFDWVVVDTPPIAILPDANLLAAMIDTALLVVSAQSTPYPMVQRAARGDRHQAHSRRRAQSRGKDRPCRRITAITATISISRATPSPRRNGDGLGGSGSRGGVPHVQ